MKIKVGEYDVHETGTVISIEGAPVDFFISEQHDFIVRMIFENDEENPEARVEGEQYRTAGVLLRFTNYNEGLGIGNITPIRIGLLDGKDLFLSYRIYSLTQGGKTIHYTWLTGRREVINE